MKNNSESKKNTRKAVAVTMSMEACDELEKIKNDIGISKSEIIRRSFHAYLDGNADEGKVVMNLIMLTQSLTELEGQIPEEQYENMKHYIDNIMLLKGV